MPATANGRRFVAGAFVEGETGDMASLYIRQTDGIQQRDGMPIPFRSNGADFPAQWRTARTEADMLKEVKGK